MQLIEANGTAERGATASWLLASADEAGIDRKLIRRAAKGYVIPDELYSFITTEHKGVRSDREVSVPVAAEPAVTPVDVSTSHPDGPPQLDERVTVPPDREVVRAWAKENGYQVADVGRIKHSLVDAYVAAHTAR